MSPSPSPMELAGRAQRDRQEQSNRLGVTYRSSTDPSHSRSTDSWIDISSHPSNSSLSSAADEVVTTGLRVQQDVANRSRRRRPLDGAMRLNLTNARSHSAGGSSQEEYEESESESDRVMTSSNEGVRPSLMVSHRPASNSSDQAEDLYDEDDDDEDDDDENATALGISPAEPSCFTPQPNAFSHPPSSHGRSLDLPVPGSYFPSSDSHQRHSYPSRSPSSRRNQPSSTSNQADHDAALRASLTTLLSCAAAVRGLPKSNQRNASSSRTQQQGQPASNRVDPATLRIVPESAILEGGSAVDDDDTEPLFPATAVPTNRRARQSPSRPGSPSQHDKSSKRKATSKDRRWAKKAKATSGFPYFDPASTSATDVSPTLLTWVVSAGVLVLVGALSFSAGYSVGRESGRAEQQWFSGFEGGNGTVEGLREGVGRELGGLKSGGGRLRSVAVAARG